jgi:hypothetical protein
MRDDRLRPPRRFPKPRFLAALLVGVALMTGACGDETAARGAETGLTGGWSTAGCEFSRVPQTVAMGDSSMPVTPPELDAAMARIDRAGRSEYADSFAGLEVDQEQVRAIVYRVPSVTFDDFIRQTAENTCITVRDAAYAATELATWQDRLVADLQTWTTQGLQIFTVGARHDGAGVEVGVQDATRAKDQLLSRYGQRAPLIFVEQGPVRPMDSPSAGPATSPPAAPRPAG